jgi:hypothetical protein
LIKKEDAQIVIEKRLVFTSLFPDIQDIELYYCGSHRKNYDKAHLNGDFSKRMIVDAQGEPIGYKKLK